MSASDTTQRIQELYERFASLNEEAIDNGATLQDLWRICAKTNYHNGKNKEICVWNGGYVSMSTVLTAVVVLVTGLILARLIGEDVVNAAMGIRCVIPNNFLIWEATRPVADCKMCRNVTSVLVLRNITQESFKQYAYSYHPMLVKGAAADWPAMKTFSYDYFKELFDSIEGSYESIEDDCQLLTFKTEFLSLKDVFSMSRARVQNLDGEQPWYIGWSNCHQPILSKMRTQYERPRFLPDDAEHTQHDFIFMGYSQGAAMHLDYISRLMWQAQLRGHKTWTLSPPPECEHICHPFSFRVEPGDIVLLDTRQWYHKTNIDDREFSLTVSSEYG